MAFQLYITLQHVSSIDWVYNRSKMGLIYSLISNKHEDRSIKALYHQESNKLIINK